MIKIDRGIPFPENTNVRQQYPWATMKKGNSFFAIDRTRQQIMPCLCTANKKHAPAVFICEEQKGGTRVWRYR